MDSRLGRITGIAAFLIMLVRLGRLMETGSGLPAWHLIMIASAFLGGVVWWLLSQTISNRKLNLALFAAGGLILFLRMAVPHTLLVGFVPTPETLEVLQLEIGDAIQTIRFGFAPVTPSAGIVAILAISSWVIGGLYSWGWMTGSTIGMVLPSMVLYMQFAVMDRRTTGAAWMIASVTVIAMSIIALTQETKSETGRVRSKDGRPMPRHSPGRAMAMAAVVGVVSIGTATAAAGLVPFNGNFPWRLGSGYGPGVGGASFDRLADLQQDLISRRGDIMFHAVLDDEAPPVDQIYWRMETLESFDGTAWRPNTLVAGFLDPGRAGGESAHRYRGTSQRIAATVTIDDLKTNVVPTAGVASDLQPETEDLRLELMTVTSAGSLIYPPWLSSGDTYTIESLLTLDDRDLAALATGSDGELTPLFAAAAEAGELQVEPTPWPGDTSRPADIERLTELPEDSTGLRSIALAKTAGARTDFERAWLLQYWFRDSDDFRYSQSVTTGHDTLVLEDWLTDPESPNYRTGYCEQFAAAMGVLGRSLGIPTRLVWGFTPGETTTQINDQGEEVEVVVVRDRNAHAWVEMWMDGFGWVSFDPTPRGGGVLPDSMTAGFDPVLYLPPPDVPTRPDLGETPDELFDRGLIEGEDFGGLGPTTPGFSFAWLFAGLALILLASLVPLLKNVRRRRRLARLRDGDITAAWEEIVDRLVDLRQPVPAHLTPLEFARSADEALVPVAVNYSAAIYGDHNGSGIEADLEAVEEWLKRRYESGQRIIATFNPRSFFDGR